MGKVYFTADHPISKKRAEYDKHKDNCEECQLDGPPSIIADLCLDGQRIYFEMIDLINEREAFFKKQGKYYDLG